ncbi:putative DNA polymerase [Stylophora pistillata]|uniref:DNA-directed DNA polymerase n=1 Tax=Stylophora pistillata TaxID=50429 RepID=A0A2B4SCN3_STYPI|nr:putative DNA polymerase [Stylophora pistillata]
MTDQGQTGSGTPLFNFEYHPIGEPAKFKNTVLKQRVRTEKKQLRDVRAGDNLGEELTRAVARVAGRILDDAGRRWRRGIRDNDQVLFNFSTPQFQHPLQSSHFRVKEVRNGSDRWDGYLQVLVNPLNSSEAFEAGDPFDVDVTLVARDGRKNVGDQEAKRYYRNIQHNPQTLTRCAKCLHREAEVLERPCGKLELAAFQAYLAPQYQLKVITAYYPYGVLFEGHVTEPPQHIVRLLYVPPVGNSDIGHYHGCTSYMAFLEKSYYCDMCNRGYGSEEIRHHPSEGRRCKACKQVACGSKPHQPTIYCQHCHRHFYDDRCVAFHHAENFEAIIQSDGTHTPFLVRAETRDSDECHTFYGPECTGEFLDFLDSLIYGTETQPIPKEESRDVICIFHNLKGYDSVFLQAQLLKEHRKFHFMIPNGTKQSSLSYRRVQFKDSLCFIPSSLAQFSSTFGIEEIKKGFFPHTFHTPENADYVGALPDRIYFDPESMSEKKKAEFEEWYQEESSRQLVYDLKRELIEYCGSDVKLLKEGCKKFVAEFRAVAGFDALEKCVTIVEYPWVKKNGLHPVGHPVILYEPENQDPTVYYGLLKVDVLPPAELFHPVLPYRHKMSSDIERCLRGTWCSPELNKAIALRYRVLRIHEVWHFEESEQGLFAPYVNTWLKIKQESAGYPAWCQDDTDRAGYVDDFRRKEGIELDPTKITKNPGRKAVAKLMLNSFWGKFGQQTNKSTTDQLTEARDLLEILDDPLLNVQDIPILSPEFVEVVYQRDASDPVKGMTTNIFIAAFMTAMARLKLYESLETVQQQVLYYDTDSVVYRWKPGDPEIPLGDHLGDMTNELDEGDWIKEFISAGAKNYAYRTHLGKICTKVKGFSLNVSGKKQLNFEVLKDNVMQELIDHCHVVTHVHKSCAFCQGPSRKENPNRTSNKNISISV